MQHLDAALERGKGVVWTYPHAGAVMLILIGTGFYIEPWLELIENSIGVMSTPFHVQGDFEDIITQ